MADLTYQIRHVNYVLFSWVVIIHFIMNDHVFCKTQQVIACNTENINIEVYMEIMCDILM